jgi:Uma2 family endonuclease
MADGRMVLNLEPLPELSEADFVRLCAANPEWRLERTAEGEIIIMPPDGGESGYRGQSIGAQLFAWAAAAGDGAAFGSSTGFRLPNGATRSPDAAWVRGDRLAVLTRDQKRAFLPLSPDLAVEVRSPSDRMPELQAKMEEYLATGAQLGWPIDADARRVHVYRPGQPVVVLESPGVISGDPELPGFVLEMSDIWEPRL